MDYMTTLQFIFSFVTAHWETFALLLGGMGGIIAVLRNKAYGAAFLLAGELVRKAAVKELDNDEKRKWCAAELFKLLPKWMLVFVPTQAAAEDIVERAYQLLKDEVKDQSGG